jgi:hypothetical protein
MTIPRFSSLDSILRTVKTDYNKGVLEGVLHVEQFCKINYQCSVSDLCAYFSRGMGVIARVNEEAYDLYLPVVLDTDHAVTDAAQNMVLEDLLLPPVSGQKASAASARARDEVNEEEGAEKGEEGEKEKRVMKEDYEDVEIADEVLLGVSSALKEVAEIEPSTLIAKKLAQLSLEDSIATTRNMIIRGMRLKLLRYC